MYVYVYCVSLISIKCVLNVDLKLRRLKQPSSFLFSGYIYIYYVYYSKYCDSPFELVYVIDIILLQTV